LPALAPAAPRGAAGQGFYPLGTFFFQIIKGYTNFIVESVGKFLIAPD
jgi:hypothetical protein